MSTETIETEILDDPDFLSALQDIEGDLGDIGDLVDDKNYTQALEELQQVQDTISAMHKYLTGKIE